MLAKADSAETSNIAALSAFVSRALASIHEFTLEGSDPAGGRIVGFHECFWFSLHDGATPLAWDGQSL